MLSGLALVPNAQAQIPFAVKFLAPSPDVRIGSDGKGLYRDAEIDVLAVGIFNFSTHDYNGKKLTGLDDLDGDGYSDVWMMEPEPGKNTEAYLLKLNKRQQHDPWGAFSVPFQLVFAKEQYASILDLID